MKGGARQRRADAVDEFIGKRIRTARMIENISQTELGEKIGVTFQQVQKYEKGTNRVGSGRLVKIAEALNREIAWFSEGATGVKKGSPRPTDIFTEFCQTMMGARLAEAFVTIKDKDMRAGLVASAEAGAAMQLTIERASARRAA